MTTAHRPTWAPAKGHEDQGGARMFGGRQQYRAKDQVSQTVMKARAEGQNTSGELVDRDLRLELELKERAAADRRAGKVEASGLLEAPLLPGPPLGGPRGPVFVPNAADADDAGDGDGDGDSDSDDSDEDDSDGDDTAAVLAELERIKRERAEETARREAAEAEVEAAERRAELAGGNPLLALEKGGGGAADFSTKRRWDDDVVFKNQARSEPKQQKRFINDTVRNDFHRRFLNRYIK